MRGFADQIRQFLLRAQEARITPEEIEAFPHKNVIVRALGMKDNVQVDVSRLEPQDGDIFLLCSDGLTNELSDERIASTLRQIANPQEAAHDLVRQARAAGGSDNITVVVVDVVVGPEFTTFTPTASAIVMPSPLLWGVPEV